jgi:hypothetical protein
LRFQSRASFADQLATALKARGFEALIDRTEIYPFEDWWWRIQSLIVKADTVIFVLSPDSIASDICQKEIAFAVSLNKRFAPIVCRPVDISKVPTELSHLNFISFEDQIIDQHRLDQKAYGIRRAVAAVGASRKASRIAVAFACAGGSRSLDCTTTTESERVLHNAPVQARARSVAAVPPRSRSVIACSAAPTAAGAAATGR